MTELTLLASLQKDIFNETKPLPGLLRTCLGLGKQIDSQLLSEWATAELGGYGQEADLPSYRKIDYTVRVQMGYGKGKTDQTFLPTGLITPIQELLPIKLEMREPVEELRKLGLRVTNELYREDVEEAAAGFDLDKFKNTPTLTAIVPGARLAGVVDQIRTALVDIVSDLTKLEDSTTISSQDVEQTVAKNVYHQHHYNIVANGPLVIGEGTRISSGVDIAEFIQLIEAIKAMSLTLGPAGTSIHQLAVKISEEMNSSQPDKKKLNKFVSELGHFVKKTGSSVLQEVAGAIGTAVGKAISSGTF